MVKTIGPNGLNIISKFGPNGLNIIAIGPINKQSHRGELIDK